MSCGFGSRKHGCYVSFDLDYVKNKNKKLIAWNNVLNGKQNGIQVWYQRQTYLILSEIFTNRRRNDHGLMQLFDLFYSELLGDKIQLLALASCHLRVKLKNKN